jgi:hypothetical protein
MIHKIAGEDTRDETFETLTAALLKIPVFRDVMLCHWYVVPVSSCHITT